MIFKLQKNKKDFDQISKMAKDEEEHLDFFDNIAKEKKIRPTMQNQITQMDYLQTLAKSTL